MHSGYRGAEIRTRDLTDPNGARYQAAPRPEERGLSHRRCARPAIGRPPGIPIATRTEGIERHHPAQPLVLCVDLDVVQQPVEFKMGHGLVEHRVDAGAQAAHVHVIER